MRIKIKSKEECQKNYNNHPAIIILDELPSEIFGKVFEDAWKNDEKDYRILYSDLPWTIPKCFVEELDITSPIKPYAKIISFTPNALETCRWAAEVSRNRVGDDPVAYCKEQGYTRKDLEQYFLMMLRESFGTPLEYISVVLYLDNVSRAAQQQITRTRTGVSFSIESMRVVPKENFATQMLYHVPDRIANDPDKMREFHQSMLDIEKEYNRLIEEGVAVEDARGILPLNIFSTITMCINMRSLFHMIFSRTCAKAQGEVHDIAVAIMEELRKYLGDTIVDAIDRPCKFKKDCMMKMENTQAIQCTTPRPLCKYFPEYLKDIGQTVEDIKKMEKF